jgi:Nucleotide-diphospho-sugar transferase
MLWGDGRRNMRNDGTKFRQLATQKPRIVKRLFKNYGFETIILSDTDTVWLRDPTGCRLLCSGWYAYVLGIPLLADRGLVVDVQNTSGSTPWQTS